MRQTIWLSILALALPACARPSSSSPTEGGSSALTADTSACSPRALKLGDAKPVTMWKPPAACKPRPDAPRGAPALVRSEAELKVHYDCEAGAALGVDFSRDALVFTTRTLSPASVGTDVLDDGKTVTFVNRQRTPCKNDPLPMPISSTLTFVVTGSSPRAFAEASCTVETKCP